MFLDSAHEKESSGHLLSRLGLGDWAGLSLFIPSAASFLIPITLGGVVYAWLSWRTILPLIIGVFGLAVLACHQRYLTKRPMFRSSLFSRATTVVSYFGGFIHGILLWILLYYLCIYYQIVRELDPIMTGVAALPATVAVAPAAVLTGIVINKSGHYRWAILLGWALSVAGFGLLWLLDVDTSVPAMVFIIITVGVGLGILVPALSIAVQASHDPRDAAHATAFWYVARSAGQCVGIAVGTAVFSNVMANIQPVVTTSDGGGGALTAESLVGLLHLVHEDEVGAKVLREGIVDALRAVWIAACAIAGLASVLGGTARYPPLPEDRRKK
jgi:hypothetical protein